MRHNLVMLAAIGVVALIVRLAAAIATGGLWAPELFEYEAIARNLLRGGGFAYGHFGVVYHSFAAPLPAWIDAAGYWLTGSFVPTMVVQAFAGAALAMVTASIATRLFGGWMAGAAAGALVAVHPGLVAYGATKTHPLVLDALFFSLALLLTFRLAERPTARRAAALGLIVGLGGLSRGTIVIFLPIAFLWMLINRTRPAFVTLVRLGVVAGICAAVVVGPWIVRNMLVHHRFVFLVTTDNEALWRGNNVYATGHSYADATRTVLDLLPPTELEEIRNQPNELAQSDWFRTHAFAFMREHPRRLVELTALKFAHFWWFAPQSGVLYPRAWLQLYMAFYVLALGLAALGVWRIAHLDRAARERLLLTVAFLFALSALQSLYYVEGRHRWAVEPMLLAVSGGGVAALAERRRGTVPAPASL